MEIKGIDVSAWQGQIDWDKVASYGMDFVFIRITEAGNVIDSCFERNFSGCKKHNMPEAPRERRTQRTTPEMRSERSRGTCTVMAGHTVSDLLEKESTSLVS